jgi:hypothetical protein
MYGDIENRKERWEEEHKYDEPEEEEMTKREQAISDFLRFKEHGYKHSFLPSSGNIEIAIEAMKQMDLVEQVGMFSAIYGIPEQANIRLKLRGKNPLYCTAPYFDGAKYIIIDLNEKIDTGEYGSFWYE